MARRSLMTAEEVREAVANLAGWKRKGKGIEKRFEFGRYAEGLEFAVRLGKLADAKNHHPDLVIGYCRVTVRWTTHDVGGITRLDIEGAKLTETARVP
jgi:4a-hydroxytetrahydrobiopterin dehydratase